MLIIHNTQYMLKISDHIGYIGADDDNLEKFENQYPLLYGVSYNSYLIDDGQLAVVDSVDTRRCGQWLEAIEAALAGRMPDYIVVQHMEPDHSGSLRAFIERYPQTRVVATAKALSMIQRFFDGLKFENITVADGDTLEVGHTLLRFFTAPMVHWPEVMMTLDETDGVLFSADAFGTFSVFSSDRGWDSEARRYYTNIVGKYGASVQAIMKKIAGQNFFKIAPLHGPVLSGNLARYWQLYDKWSRYEPETDGVLVAYASIYGGTEEAAHRLAVALRNHGVAEVVEMDLCRHHVSFAVAEAFRLSRMALCCSTYDAGLFPPMQVFLNRLKSKGLRNRKVGFIENGSWAPVAAGLMRDAVGEMKDMEPVAPVVTICSRMRDSDLPQIDSLAAALADNN